MSALEGIASRLHEYAGFSLPESELRQAVERRMKESQCAGVERYFQMLKDSPHELTELVEELIVPETFFFRYEESFNALRQWVSERGRRPVRILSLACSTGEEPYSVVMTLLDNGFQSTDFEVEARDLSASALARAEAGFYTQKSFRQQGATWRERYFVSHRNGWQIDPAIRNLVRFTRGNLTQIREPGQWDVIFCRNVLIYFSSEKQRDVAARLREALKPDGILFLGPVEPMVLLEQGWISMPYPMSFAVVPREVAKRPVAPITFKKPRTLVRPRPSSDERIAPAPVPPKEMRHNGAPRLDQLQAMADGGQLDQARAGIAEFLQQEPENAAAFFLQGLIEESLGRVRQAEMSYRKVLFIDPAHQGALQHMSLLLRGQGRSRAAEQFKRRAAQGDDSR